MLRRDLGRLLLAGAGGLVVASHLPSTLPSVARWLADEQEHRYWPGWTPQFRQGERILSRPDVYKTPDSTWDVSVDFDMNANGVVADRRKLSIFALPLGQSGPTNIEVWKHDGWYYGLLNDHVMGTVRIPDPEAWLNDLRATGVVGPQCRLVK